MTRIEKNMAEGPVNIEAVSVAPQTVSGEAKSPIPGMPLDLYNTLSKRHSFETIQKQQSRFATHEEFLADAKKEAERIRTVLKNAQLPDEKRLQEAGKLLGYPLSAEQRDALKRMHEVGKERPEAGIFNYTTKEIGQKIKEGREAFTKEEWKALIKSGLAGVLPPAEFAGFDPGIYAGDPKLGRIAGKIKITGDAGRADEGFLYKIATQIRRLDDEAEIDSVQAQDILTKLTAWQTEADDSLLPYAERVNIEQQLSMERKSKSEFNMAVAFYEYYSSIDISTLALGRQTELQNRKDALRLEIQSFVDEARNKKILEDVDKRTLTFYNQVKGARRREKYGGRDKQSIIDYARGSYRESFWKDSPEFLRLEKRFAGVAAYIWEGVVSEVEKEANNVKSEPFNVVAIAEFDRLKEQRRVARAKEKKYETNPYYGQLNYELTAENAEELAPAVLDFVGDQIAELSRDPSMASGQIDQIRQRAVSMLEANRFYLEKEEGQDISATHPDFLRARYIAEAVTDVLGNEFMLYKGGEDVGPQYKKRFASEFIGHHDAVYLENQYAAYIMHKLTKHRNGTYWLGQPLDSEKLDEGGIEDYRRMIEEEVKEDAFTHELFITEEDFRKRKTVDSNGLERDLTYSFDDNIEKLLLDPDGSVRADVITKLSQRGATQAEIDEALNRHDTRVIVFRTIKERLDKEERLDLTSQERQQVEQQIGRFLTPTELLTVTNNYRKEKIRRRILQQMDAKSKHSYIAQSSKEARKKLIALDMTGKHGSPEYDQILWKWVEGYNKYRIKLRLPRWQPSGWDRVRMRIDRPTKVLDRTLSGEELENMYEPIVLPEGYSYEDIKTRKRTDDVRFGFQLARSYQIFTMQDTLLGGMRTRLIDINTGQYTGRLMDDEASLLLGLIDQNGRVINPNRKLVRVFDIVQARLEAAITEEAAEINQLKTAKAAAIASGNQSTIDSTTKALRDKLVNAQFLATHVLKEIGLVEGKLPVWSYNFLDDSTLDVFMKALADFGVETAENIPISHDDKGLFYEIVERGRRALKSEWDRATQEHMATSYKVLARNPDGTLKAEQARSLWRAADDFGGEKGKEMSSRYRMVSKGAVDKDRKVTDTRLEISTSGGVAVSELIPEIADLGFYPLLVWLGVTDVRSLHGYIHRRDETEFHKHKYFHVMDPVQHADSLGAAYKAIKALTGGKLDDGKSLPGVLKEPFHGGFKSADWIQNQMELIKSYGLTSTYDYSVLMQQYRESGMTYTQFQAEWTSNKWKGNQPDRDRGQVLPEGKDMERLRQMTYLDLGKMSKTQIDEFYLTMSGIFDYFQDYLKELKPIETSRRGRAPRNWEENNHKKFYAWRRLMREAIQGKKEKRVINGGEQEVWVKKPEEGFIMRLGYSPEVASELALSMFETVLMDADYLILRGYEVDRRVKDGLDILSPVLTGAEKQQGFVIPDEKEWPRLRPELQKALKTIRRRGLLEFMTEEGYKLGNKEVLGKKIPPLVQETMAQEDKTNSKVVSYKL